jgi:hypothetical protein
MATRDDAENTVVYLAVCGVLAGVLGTVLAVTQWPDDQGYDSGGNAPAAYLGLALAGLGQLAFFVAVVAYAVRLGVRWSGLLDRDAPAAPVRRSYLDEDGL